MLIYIYKQLGAQNCYLHKYISRGGSSKSCENSVQKGNEVKNL